MAMKDERAIERTKQVCESMSMSACLSPWWFRGQNLIECENDASGDNDLKGHPLTPAPRLCVRTFTQQTLKSDGEGSTNVFCHRRNLNLRIIFSEKNDEK